MEDFVKDRFGADKLAKLNNMHQGGKNNEKGNRLEDRFAVFKIVSLAPLATSEEPNLSLLKQEKGFVDDVVITYPNSKKKENYQAKDVKEITWSAFTDNFHMQHTIDTEHYGYDTSWTNALLAQEGQYTKLSGKIPESIKHHTKCVYFPNDESLPSLILKHSPLKEGLARLSKKKDDLSHYETIFAQILGQWSISESGLIADILEKTKYNARPDLFISDKLLDFDIKALKILADIPGLTYSLDSEELHINCKGFEFLLASAQLGNVEQCEILLKEQQPETVVELIEVWKALSKVCG
ncbi:TPA: hypothetical protein ACVO3J_000704 [Vibrio alginolyticus]|uniref:hypothetical protein n=1 Tax=Vibrio harveyi group TaxID=717610 RepID=UPI00062E6996|nr:MULTISPECIES: hypothetical protein [Vibrio harveyi group]ELB2752614.1 hypothetical protein [Vibrio alginolyticus]ELB2804467.1 hypothetical protein [Vibrio alginolyticus]ELB2845989.1 hypothetical protein [Vibrio alginolyticus]KLE24164.1 hypothetical protein AAW52_13350 [Vibrio diabolicus]KPN01929.1 hypothetical protein AOR11_15295 [Vibrio alginolyticus]